MSYANRAVTVSAYRVRFLPTLVENPRDPDRGAGVNPRALSKWRLRPVRHEDPFWVPARPGQRAVNRESVILSDVALLEDQWHTREA